MLSYNDAMAAEERLLAIWEANPRPLSVAENVTDIIGNTPLVRLKRVLSSNPKVEILGKFEPFNPGGSVKDRPVKRMIEDAENDGILTHESTLLDSTSGNTGIAYAMICASRDYSVELAMPGNVSRERVSIVRAFGADVQFSDPLEGGSDGAIALSNELLAAHPDRYVKLDQYNNPSNWKAHYDTTGVEIWEQTEGRITHLVSMLGTSGTCMGTGRRLKEFSSDVQVVAAQPSDGFHGIEGTKHMDSSIVPGIYDADVPDMTVFVDTDCAYETTRRLAREEGLMCGQSSGGAVCAAMEIAETIDEGLIVCIFSDSGDRYLSTRMWEWNRE